MSLIDRKPKPNTKLIKFNVPETVWEHFLQDVPAGESSIIDKLRVTAPQARGRGLTRVVHNITEAEWEDMYARCAHIRANMKKTEDTGELRAAVCAKSMSFRMEQDGVANVVRYETATQINGYNKPGVVAVRRKKPETPAAIPPEPITLVTTDDVDEVEDDELTRFKRDLALGTT